jgi:hypothetical protein
LTRCRCSHYDAVVSAAFPTTFCVHLDSCSVFSSSSLLTWICVSSRPIHSSFFGPSSGVESSCFPTNYSCCW